MNRKYEDLTRKEIIAFRKEIMQENGSLKLLTAIITFSSVFIVFIPGQLLYPNHKYTLLIMCIITGVLASILWRIFLYPKYTKIIKQKLENQKT